MKTIGVYYFSGTGNTELVAGMIREEFLQRGVAVDLIRIEDVLKNRGVPDPIPPGRAYDLIGIGNPVNGFGSPRIVLDFIKKLPEGKGKKIFLFKTAGGVAPINYNASQQVIRKLSRQGYQVVYDRVFAIGSNWVVKFKDSVMRDLFEATRRKTRHMAEEIIQGKIRSLRAGFPLSCLIAAITFAHDRVVRFLAKDFRVTSACAHCGKCIRNCPTANIYEKKGRIRFRISCLWCLRCLYGCPQKAIQHRLLSFCTVPGGYDIRKTLADPNLSPDSPGNTPPFYRNYLQNDEL